MSAAFTQQAPCWHPSTLAAANTNDRPRSTTVQSLLLGGGRSDRDHHRNRQVGDARIRWAQQRAVGALGRGLLRSRAEPLETFSGASLMGHASKHQRTTGTQANL